MKKAILAIAICCASSLAAIAQSVIVGSLPQFAQGTAASVQSRTQTTLDSQGNFTLAINNAPNPQSITMTPLPGSPYAPFTVSVTFGPGATNITALLQAQITPIQGVYLGLQSAATVGTNAQGYAIAGSGVSQKVFYASQILGAHPGVSVTPGSSAASTSDSYAALNAITSAGNVDLEVDSGFALSNSLALGSNTLLHCTAPQYGFIMQPGANAPALINTHQNAPTTSSGTGGYLVSNIQDVGITVSGCTVNANSTQAVTGVSSPPHKFNPAGVSVFGVSFAGVQGLTFSNNDLYDSGTAAFFGTNLQNPRVIGNIIHQPSPLVAAKNTDGVHFIGPDDSIFNQNNIITAGDDSIAYNADDDNIESPSTVPAFVKNGPITNVHDDNNLLQNTYFGLRLYSGTSLIDNVAVSNLHGSACGNTGNFAANTGVGSGNLGTVRIDGWNLPTSGTCNTFGVPYNFLLSSNFKSLQIAGVQITNPGVNWPMITQTAGAGGILSLRDWDLNTQVSGFSNVVVTNGGSIAQLASSGTNWSDNAGNSTSFFAGSVVPSLVTCSNYSGPNRLLAAGYSPTIKNGDCFTNTYPSSTVYINTTFNEASSGTALAGTTPSTCANGCTGSWTLPSGTDFTYQTGGGVATSTINSAFDVINAGAVNGVYRFNISTCSGGSLICQFLLRGTNASNNVVVSINVGTSTCIYDIISGTPNQLSCGGLAPLGNYAVTFNGSSISVLDPNSATISATTVNTTGTLVGMAAAAASSMKVLSLSVKSN